MVVSDSLYDNLSAVDTPNDANYVVDFLTDTNSGADFWSQAMIMLLKVSPPIILILGMFGNIMAIIIHRRLSRQSAMSLYFVALAVADIGLLVFGLVQVWTRYEFAFDVEDLTEVTCRVYAYGLYVSGAMSAWLLVAVTLQRAASVVVPHRVNALCTRGVSQTIIAAISITLISLHAHIIYGKLLRPEAFVNVTLPRDCYFIDQHYEAFFFNVWSWFDLLVFSVTPFAILLLSNIVLLKTVVTSVRTARHRLAVGDPGQVNSREKRASSLTVTLIALSFTFFLLTMPYCAYLLSYAYVMELIGGDSEKESFHQFLHVIANQLWYLNSAINFYLYCLTGHRFREEFMKIVLTCRVRPTDSNDKRQILTSKQNT